MTWLARFAALRSRPTDTAAPDITTPCPHINAADLRSALNAAQTQSADGWQRQALIARAAQARQMRQSKRASLIEADLRAVTNSILRGKNARG